MNKNPFSFYDFLGYLFPGIIILALTVFAVALAKESAPIEEYFQINKFVDVFQDKQGLKWWETTILTIILAYVAGHIFSYLSSVMVEYLPNRLFGYPSHYLLHAENINPKMLFQRYFVLDRNPGRLLWRIIVVFALFPLIPLLFLGKYLKADYHRIVMHYVYLNIPNCQRKADNYVAIYGFLRTMTLIACIYFDYFFYWQVFTLNIHAGVNWNAVLILLLMGILCDVLFMGFVKFYRRFTLENYMALLTEKTTPQ